MAIGHLRLHRVDGDANRVWGCGFRLRLDPRRVALQCAPTKITRERFEDVTLASPLLS